MKVCPDVDIYIKTRNHQTTVQRTFTNCKKDNNLLKSKEY